MSEVTVDIRPFPTPTERDMDSLDRVMDEAHRTREIQERFRRNVAQNEIERIVTKMGLRPLWTTEDKK